VLAGALLGAACGTVEVDQARSGATLAGAAGGPGFFDGPGGASAALVRFDGPSAVAVIGTDVFVADAENHVIRRIDAAGNVSTAAGVFGAAGSADGTAAAARFRNPQGLAADGAVLYVCDTGNHTIRKLVTAGGVVTAVTTLAGSPGSPGASDNAAGPGGVRFFSPRGIVFAPALGALFVADTGNHRIRRVSPAGATITFAGSGAPGAADGSGAAASFRSPSAIAAIGSDLFVADTGNHTIRKIAPGVLGDVTTLAGSPGTPGAADGTGSQARFREPQGIATDGVDLFVADTGNHTLRRVTPAGAATTLAGSAGLSGHADGTGEAARFDGPRGLAASGFFLYVADAGNHVVRRADLSGSVATLAGNPPRRGLADGTGSAARFDAPAGLAAVGDNIFVADAGNGRIRKVTPAGAVTVFAGGGGEFASPAGVVAVGTDLFVTDAQRHTVSRVSAAGTVTLLAGQDGVPGAADGVGAAARFNAPRGIAAADGVLYVADTGNHTIRKVTLSGEVTTVAGTAGQPGAADASAGTSARFDGPRGVAVLGSFLYVADTGNHTIRRVTLSSASYPVTTFAGAAGQPGFAEGTGAAARFFSPEAIAAVESALYVADRGNHAIRRLSTTAHVTNFAGNSAAATTRDGEGALLLFNAPAGIAGLPGRLYVSDALENVIRRVDF